MRRFAILLGLTVVVGLPLAACNLLYPPKLVVSHSSMTLTTTGPQPLVTVANATGSPSSLDWHGSTDDSRVTLQPASGSGVNAGHPQRVAVLIDASAMSVGQTIKPTITITSNGGSASVPLQFTKTSTSTADCGVSMASFAASGAGTARQGQTGRAAYVPGELIVEFAAQTSRPSGSSHAAQSQTLEHQVASAYHLTVVRSGGGEGPSLVRAADASAALAALRADPRVQFAERNYRVYPLRAPTDPCYAPEQWNLSEFGLQQAWNVETGSDNQVVVAVIDAGVQTDHPDLRDKLLQGWDFYDGNSDTDPGAGVVHGTHVAGIAAALGDNLTGIAGVAFGPKVMILPVKIFDDSGQNATAFLLEEAIRWAAGLPVSGAPGNPHPADVINISLGVDTGSTVAAIDQAASQAFQAGSLIVAAAGNHNSADPGVNSPANAPSVIAVGSVNSDYRISTFSNTDNANQQLADGTGVELMAPGGLEVAPGYSNSCGPVSVGTSTGYDIYSTYPAGGYGCETGTSMASPFVAGIAALLKSQNPSRTPSQLRAILDGAVKPNSDQGQPSDYGYGVICADKAVGAATTCGQ